MSDRILTYKYRLYPTMREESALSGQLSEACRLYNAALQERRDAWKMARVNVSFASQSRQIKDIRAAGDIGLPTHDVATDVVRRVARSFSAFFRRVKGGQSPGYPRFRSAKRYDSLTFPHFNKGIGFVGQNRIRVAGVGSMRVRLHRQPLGVVKAASIKRDGSRWYLLLCCRVPPAPMLASQASIGLDVGLSSFVAGSDGSVVAAPQHFRQAEKALRRAQRKFARCQRRSRRRQAQRLAVERIHARVRNQRADFHHKLARQIVNAHQLIAVEDLNVKGLARTRLAKSIHDAGWSSFIDKLTYKAESAGRQLVKVNPAGTSQTCVCGAAVPKRLSDRWHDCPDCGLSAPRDVVSARVILARAAPAVANTGVVPC